MAINLSKLSEVEPLVLDFALFQGNILQNMKINGIEQAGGFFGLGVMLLMFLFLFWHYYRKDGKILFDIVRSGAISSGFTTIIGLVAVSLGFFSSYIHVVWFGTIFMFFLVGVIKLKLKGV